MDRLFVYICSFIFHCTSPPPPPTSSARVPPQSWTTVSTLSWWTDDVFIPSFFSGHLSPQPVTGDSERRKKKNEVEEEEEEEGRGWIYCRKVVIFSKVKLEIFFFQRDTCLKSSCQYDICFFSLKWCNVLIGVWCLSSSCMKPGMINRSFHAWCFIVFLRLEFSGLFVFIYVSRARLMAEITSMAALCLLGMSQISPW